MISVNPATLLIEVNSILEAKNPIGYDLAGYYQHAFSCIKDVSDPNYEALGVVVHTLNEKYLACHSNPALEPGSFVSFVDPVSPAIILESRAHSPYIVAVGVDGIMRKYRADVSKHFTILEPDKVADEIKAVLRKHFSALYISPNKKGSEEEDVPVEDEEITHSHDPLPDEDHEGGEGEDHSL